MWKRSLFVALGLGVAGGLTLSVMAARYQAVYAPGTKVGPVDLSGLTPETASTKLKNWWGARQLDTYTLSAKQLSRQLPAQSLIQWGARLDLEKSLAQIQPQEFGDSLRSAVGNGSTAKSANLVFTFEPSVINGLKKFVQANRPATAPARLSMANGKLVRTPEQPALELDEAKYQETIIRFATGTDSTAELPLVSSGKSMTDKLFAKLKEPMVTFTTTFPVRGHRDRVNNIDIASGKIDGLILMPGETFSFNQTVGKRTIDAGFKEAPVFVNGRHETGVGGGICQVSTTLYNAALRADLKITERRNHSLPVAYVPAGCDATVDYGTTDLKIQNNYDFPIAFIRSFKPGTLSWTVVGTKDPSLRVEIVRGPTKYFGAPTQTIRDRSLPAGKTVVVEKGSTGKSLRTWRVVFRGGKLVRREDLGLSFYRGGPRVVRVGTRPGSAPMPAPAPTPVTPGPESTQPNL